MATRRDTRREPGTSLLIRCSAFVIVILGTATASPATGQPAMSTATRLPSPPPRPAPPASPYLGAVVTTNSQSWAPVLPRSDAKGALVMAVVPASPAAKAGIAPGDVIAAIDGLKVASGEDVEIRLKASHRLTRLVTLVPPAGASRTVPARLAKAQTVVLSDHLAKAMVADPSVVTRYLFAENDIDVGVALATLDGVVGEAPQFAEAHAQRAFLLSQVAAARRSGGAGAEPPEAATAKEAVARAVALDQDSLEVRTMAARAFLILHHPQQAEQHAARAVAIEDSSAAAHNVLGGSLVGLGRADEGLVHLRRAVALSPHFVPYYETLARAYQRVGAQDHAARTFAVRDFIQGAPGPAKPGWAGKALWYLLAAAGLLLLALGVAAGLRQLGAARAARRLSPTARLALAEGLAVLGAWTVAIPYLGSAFGLAPEPAGTIELFDHVIPGAVVLVLGALVVHALVRPRQPASRWPRWGPVITFLAGLWVTRMHVPFVEAALDRDIPWSLVALHASPVLPLLGISALLYREARADGHSRPDGSQPEEASPADLTATPA